MARDQRFNVVTASLRRPARVRGRERMTITSSVCGVCGTASIEALRAIGLPAVGEGPRSGSPSSPDSPTSCGPASPPSRSPGSVHGRPWWTPAGTVLIIREDVGRHNAVDKAIGCALLDRRLPLPETVLVVSGRVSFEIVQKAARAGIAMIAAVSGPTSLAVSLADEIGITLAGFVRGGDCVVYSHPERVVTE